VTRAVAFEISLPPLSGLIQAFQLTHINSFASTYIQRCEQNAPGSRMLGGSICSLQFPSVAHAKPGDGGSAQNWVIWACISIGAMLSASANYPSTRQTLEFFTARFGFGRIQEIQRIQIPESANSINDTSTHNFLATRRANRDPSMGTKSARV
jgi:hypothetical protein